MVLTSRLRWVLESPYEDRERVKPRSISDLQSVATSAPVWTADSRQFKFRTLIVM